MEERKLWNVCGLLGTVDLSFPHAVHLEVIVILRDKNRTGLETSHMWVQHVKSQKLKMFVILDIDPWRQPVSYI